MPFSSKLSHRPLNPMRSRRMRIMKRMLSTMGLLFGLTLLAAGCDNLNADKEDSPAEAAQKALDIEEPDETEKEVETQRNVDVIKETTVVDKQTGQVLSREKEVTPVTV